MRMEVVTLGKAMALWLPPIHKASIFFLLYILVPNWVEKIMFANFGIMSKKSVILQFKKYSLTY
jgi:hypothetical protein